jgi:hypothetical protein
MSVGGKSRALGDFVRLTKRRMRGVFPLFPTPLSLMPGGDFQPCPVKGRGRSA